MKDRKLTYPWEIRSVTRGQDLTGLPRFNGEQAAECAQVIQRLADEEAVVWNTRFGATPGLILVLRESDRIWIASRELLRPGEDLGELARVYSMIARGSDATVFTDASARLLAGSRRWRDIYGFSPGELIGQNPRIINSRQHPRSFYQKMWKDLTDHKIGTWSAELLNRRKNGDMVRVWQTITTVRSPDGTIQGYLGQTRDMTAHAAIREQLTKQNIKLAELNHFKGELVEIMAHDLKAPLQSIIGFSELLAGSPALEDARKSAKYAANIHKAGESMLSLVQNFLQLQRSESGELTAVKKRGSLHNLLRTIVELQRAAEASRNVEIRLEVAGFSRPAYFDAIRLEQALNNILSNALKYSPDGGLITVRVTCEQGEAQRIEVEDEGPGIPEGDMELIFDVYHQVKGQQKQFGSVGWGLAIARKVMELHGGRIRAENIPGSGCRFTLDLPYGYELYGTTREIGTVVILDPEENWCRLVLAALRAHSIPCFIASNGDEFATLCDHELPDVILIDAGLEIPVPKIQAPDSGLELTPAFGKILASKEAGPVTLADYTGPPDYGKILHKIIHRPPEASGLS